MSIAAPELATTPLHKLHVEQAAKMVPFAGYSMPVQYPTGVLKEHNHTRTQAGLFDVSHMGQVRLSGVQAALALETLMPVDVIDLGIGRQRYGMFTDARGGILDDLMISNFGDHIFLVVNAACKRQDAAHLRKHLGGNCVIEELSDRALLALQGPAAAAVMARLAPHTAEMIFMDASVVNLAGVECYVSRSGYTGEDGYEISVPALQADALAREFLAQPEVALIGLGARDSLRLEAGLCLYGHDMDSNTTPVEASLIWALSKCRRAGGLREGGYLGADAILRQLAEGAARKRVGLLVKDRTPVREGAELVDAQERVIGKVTSGGFGPTVNCPVAMAYVDMSYAKLGTALHAIVRGKQIAVEVVQMPFSPHRYFRG